MDSDSLVKFLKYVQEFIAALDTRSALNTLEQAKVLQSTMEMLEIVEIMRLKN